MREKVEEKEVMVVVEMGRVREWKWVKFAFDWELFVFGFLQLILG